MLKSELKTKSDKKTGLLTVDGETIPVSLSWYGGSLLANVEITTIFWGTGWATQSSNISSINSFLTDIIHSTYISGLTEYNADGFTIGNGKFIKTVTINERVNTNVSDQYIQNKLGTWISNKTVGSANSNSLYFIFVNNGTKVWLPDGSGSGTNFLGYHGAFNSGATGNYAVIPYPSNTDVTDMGLTSWIDAVTVISSHELVEAITDPGLTIGWYDMNYGEIGDPCEGSYKGITVGSNTWKVQTYYSMARQTCG